jgi:pimeloyl-ACP methyl ester carboxylesterase
MGDSAFEVDEEWVHLSYKEAAAMRDVYGFSGTQGTIHLEGVRFTPSIPSRTLLIYMHPASTLQLLPVPRAMARAGAHVLCAGSRYARNDAPLIMENVLRDYGAYVNHAKEHLKYEKVVVCGWSGGGSLTAFYQSQAQRPHIQETPAGDPVDLSRLTPGDALIWHAAHLSRADVLVDFIDPSVLDENVPTLRDPELDLYDPRNGNRPPYSRDYLTYFRNAQLARVRRRTALVKQLLYELRSGRTGEVERAILTHRTLAEPRFLDGTIDPNDRRIGWSFLGEPEASNNSPAGIARYSTLRAWLSQWSIDDTNARALRNAPNITVPAMIVENSADDAVPQPHSRMFFEAVASQRKKFIRIEKADHYYSNQPEQLLEVVQATMGWLRENKLLE